MTSRTPTRADDERILAMLDLRDGDNLGQTRIARHFGVTKSAVAGVFHRVRTEEVKDCACTKPENKDGGMGRLWWMK